MKLPSSFFLFFLFLSIIPSQAFALINSPDEPDSFTVSYSEKAVLKLVLAVTDLSSEFSQVNEDVLPHEVKLLRKKIGATKFYFDFFAYAYPQDVDGRDHFMDFRDFLDDGYGYYGDFKDQFDFLGIPKEEVTEAHYDPYELIRLRKKVLEWTETFMDMMNQDHGLMGVLLNPLEDRIEERSSRKPSRFIWGGCDCVPDVKKDNFGKILEKLLVKLAKKAKIRFEKASTIETTEEILDHEAQEDFHDFRKQLRYIVKMNKFFPGVYSEKVLNHPSFLFLEDLVSRYGSINDLMTKSHYIVEKMCDHEEHKVYGHNRETLEELGELWDRIRFEWNQLKDYQAFKGARFHLDKLNKLILELYQTAS